MVKLNWKIALIKENKSKKWGLNWKNNKTKKRTLIEEWDENKKKSTKRPRKKIKILKIRTKIKKQNIWEIITAWPNIKEIRRK
jgi:hypothetical protein